MKNPFRNPFRKSPPPAIAPVVRSPELQARVERITRIIEAASVQALDRHGKTFAKLADSAKLQRQFELIDALPDELFGEFLDMLEAGVPDEFKHMLRAER
jgi:hypothetical protein